MSSDSPLHGLLAIDKPEGPTSHDVVARVKQILRIKAGHTGTLDPLASGVLPLLLGHATRLARFYQGHDKEYEFTIRLGRTTDTDDREGKTLEERAVPACDRRVAEELLSHFQGSLKQRPPAYAAIKVRGRKLYEYARRGQSVESPPRQVEVHKLELLQIEGEDWRLRVHCSAGTYVRSLARDIGQALGCGAYVERLRRTRAGRIGLTDAIALDRVAEDWRQGFHPLEALLPEFPVIELDADQAVRALNGNPVTIEGLPAQGLCRLFHEGRLLALATAAGGTVKPDLVFPG